MESLDATLLLELTRLSSQLVAGRPTEELLTAVARAAMNVVGAEHAVIRWISEEGAGPIRESGASSEVATRECEHQASSQKMESVHVYAESSTVGDMRRWATKPRRTCLQEPLRVSGKMVGSLSVDSRRVSAFGLEARLLIRLLATFGATVVEREQLRRLVLLDHNTLTLAHRYLFPRIEEEIARARAARSDLSILMMDLDKFKEVNDTYGHAVGDMTLRKFADRVRADVRQRDVFIRRGGEEFVLIMPATDNAQATVTAARIRRNLSKGALNVSPAVRIAQTVSIGVATWDGSESAFELESRADLAMYAAKRSGRNRVSNARPPIQIAVAHDVRPNRGNLLREAI